MDSEVSLCLVDGLEEFRSQSPVLMENEETEETWQYVQEVILALTIDKVNDEGWKCFRLNV